MIYFFILAISFLIGIIFNRLYDFYIPTWLDLRKRNYRDKIINSLDIVTLLQDTEMRFYNKTKLVYEPIHAVITKSFITAYDVRDQLGDFKKEVKDILETLASDSNAIHKQLSSIRKELLILEESNGKESKDLKEEIEALKESNEKYFERYEEIKKDIQKIYSKLIEERTKESVKTKRP